MRTLWCLACALALFTSTRPAFGQGGSVAFADVQDVLQQKPRLAKYLASTLDIAESGDARRLGRQFTHLGGKRIGPYTFDAKPKGAEGAFQFQVTLCTTVKFVDERGQESEEINVEAVTVRETFKLVQIREIGETTIPLCPD